MKTITRFLLVLAVVSCSLSIPGCKTLTGSGPGPVTAPVPVVAGVLDCAGPSFWKTISFANLIPIEEHAVGQKAPLGAIDDLLTTYGEAEVTCVAAYLNDLGAKQSLAAPTNPVVGNRVSVTAQWLAREKAKGVGPIVNYGTPQ